MKQSRVTLGIMLVLGVSLVTACLYQKPRTDRAKLAVRFVAFTNDVFGGNLAIFSLSNPGNSRVLVTLPGVVELRYARINTSGRCVDLTWLAGSSCPSMTTVVVSENPTHDHWRVAFSYWTLRSKYSRLLHRCAISLASRLPTPWAIKIRDDLADFSTVYSQWIDPPALLDSTGFDWIGFGATPTIESSELTSVSR